MKDNRKIIYYTDELNDEFSITQIQPRKIDRNYDYDGKPLRKILIDRFISSFCIDGDKIYGNIVDMEDGFAIFNKK